MNTQVKKQRHTTHFLIESFTFLLLISAGAFLCLGFYMNKVSKEAIDGVGDLYMKSVSEQITSHFETLINLKLEQAETVVKVVPSEFERQSELYEELIYRTQARNFNYLALASQEGNLQMLFGEQIRLADPDPFIASLQKGEKKVAVGYDASGNEVVLFGITANYPMKNNEPCMAIVSALPIEYINTMLNTEEDDSFMYSQIIRKDGSFIASDIRTKYPDYFSSVYERYTQDSPEKISLYIRELTQAMEQKANYSVIMDLDNSRQQIYCNPLPYSEWHLLTVLPFGPLNETVEKLNRDRTNATILIFAIILFALLFIFYNYYKMTCSQLKDLDLARQEALHATKAKSEFLSNMSHDIRTPMNAIVGMTAIATAHIDDKEQVQNCLKKITLSGKHLLGLINDVLDMSKIESGKMTLTAERISLREVFDGIVSIVQEQIKGKEQNFNVHIDNVITEDVYCDSVRLNQILLNLLSNAVKYTQEGGTIQLSLYQEEAPSEKGDTFVRTHIKVEDNGIGMTREFMEQIFDSYSRADTKRVQKTEGAGLGMAITKYIVDTMGGDISVVSEPNQGTAFHLILDMEKAAVSEKDMLLPPWKILVIDDDEILCRSTAEALESIGIQADWTMSGKKALEMITHHHDIQDDYQIILLDWKLADMDGVLVSKQIRRIMGTEMPILLISAYDWSEFEGEAKKAGISGFISKPLFKSTLFYSLKKYMGIEEALEETNQDTDLSGRHILAAEDNDLNWEILNELLSDIGIELDWAENGQICLEKFQEASPNHYDAILMDIRMPVMNGYESAKAIRSLSRPDAQTIPIIAMTADAFSKDIQKCLDSGMNAHTAKPINLDEVISLLKKYIS